MATYCASFAKVLDQHAAAKAKLRQRSAGVDPDSTMVPLICGFAWEVLSAFAPVHRLQALRADVLES
jgi:hypothetical protein